MIPKITAMDVYPVAGHDSMELNLSGAHAPYFTRNVVVLTDSEGNLGVGEVPVVPVSVVHHPCLAVHHH